MVIGLDAFRYAAANARVRGLYSRLLDKTDWHALVAAQDLDAAIALLRTSVYGDAIGQAEHGGTIRLEQVERGLWATVAGNCQRAMAFTGGGVYSLIVVWWRHFELQNLKAILRGFDLGMSPERVRTFLIPLGERYTLPWDVLLHEHSMDGLVDRLANTRYGKVLRAAYPSYQRDGSLFVMEIAADIRYYRDLAAAIMRFKGDEGKDARRVLGTRLDMLNILWAFRHRIYYNLSPEEIINYTLWHTIRTDTNLIRDIALGAGPRDILARVWGEDAFDLSLLEGVESQGQMMLGLEVTLNRYWRSLASRAMRGYPFRLGALLGYLVLADLEAHDLVTVLEGKGMGWDAERISEYLIGWEE